MEQYKYFSVIDSRTFSWKRSLSTAVRKAENKYGKSINQLFLDSILGEWNFDKSENIDPDEVIRFLNKKVDDDCDRRKISSASRNYYDDDKSTLVKFLKGGNIKESKPSNKKDSWILTYRDPYTDKDRYQITNSDTIKKQTNSEPRVGATWFNNYDVRFKVTQGPFTYEEARKIHNRLVSR